MKKIFLSFSFLVIFLISHIVPAQPGLAPIELYIRDAQKKWNVPGLAVGIVWKDRVLMSKGFGVLEEGKSEKVDGQTLFAIASNTKGFLSSAIATLVSEGKLSWDDKVKDYLPYFELYDPYVTNEVTIQDLLSHRVGLGTFSGDAIWYKSELPAKEVIKLIKNVPQAYSFRGGYGYSNLMFITAGEVVRAVTGKSWDTYVKEKFFTPLNMDRTITSTNDLSEKGNFATPHKTQLDKNTPIEWVNWDNMSSAGAIISSTDDMSQWLLMHLNKGTYKGKNLLEPDQQNRLWSIHNSFVLSEEAGKRIPGRHFTGYGLGFGLQDYYGRKMVSHGGGYDGMYSRVVMLPEERFGVVILTNSMSGISSPLAYYIINSLIDKDKRDWISDFYSPQETDERIIALKEAQKRGTKPTLDLEQYAGEYFADMYGDILVKIQGGQLKLQFSHSPKLSATLKHWHNDTWEIQWDETHAWFDFGLVNFQLSDRLEVVGMQMNVPNGDIFFDEYDIRKK